MTLSTTLPGSFLLQCDEDGTSGNEAWAHAHTKETGHSVFTVLPV